MTLDFWMHGTDSDVCRPYNTYSLAMDPSPVLGKHGCSTTISHTMGEYVVAPLELTKVCLKRRSIVFERTY